jgi:putative ABC transport system permease protein
MSSAVPTWAGVAASLALVAVAAAIAAGTAATMGSLLALGVISTQARVVIPVGGMIVSGAMVATAVTLTRIRDEAATARPAVEARLSLGLPAAEAFAPHLHAALRTALIPAIDSTKTVGLISLPGAMTGLILAGVSPLTAIRYQIVVMYMLLAAAALAALAAARLAQRALFDHAHRLRPLPATAANHHDPAPAAISPRWPSRSRRRRRRRQRVGSPKWQARGQKPDGRSA